MAQTPRRCSRGDGRATTRSLPTIPAILERTLPSDSFHCCLPSIICLSSDSLPPYTALALHFCAIQVVPPRHYGSEIRQDQKVASLTLPRPSAWDGINDPTSPRELIHSVFSHFLTIRRLVKCCDDISLYLSEYICGVMVEMLLTLPAQMMARHCSLISAQHVLISMNV